MNTGIDRRHETSSEETKSRAPYLIVATALLVVVSVFAFLKYQGTLGSFLLFNVSYLVLATSVFPRPRLYVYTFLALLLFLGFWVKFVAHMIFQYPFVEPIGGFDGSGREWDQALVVASFAAFGVIAVRSLHLLYFRNGARISSSPDNEYVPEWFVRYRKFAWVLTLLLVVALNSLNGVLSFYQVGVTPRVVLPLQLNIVAAWLVNIGFALLISVLVHWEFVWRGRLRGRTLVAPIAEGFLSTVFMLSRKIFIFHTLPYALVLVERRSEFWCALTKRSRAGLILLLILGFLLSIVAVSVLRVYAYPTYDVYTQAPPAEASSKSGAPVPAPANEEQASSKALAFAMSKQVLGLAVDRWTGLEGVLAVSSQQKLGQNLLYEVVTEDPNKGERATYQVTSGASRLYAESEQTTFMTLPGSAAVLYYSGSLVLVSLGMGTLTLLIVVVEISILRFIGNPYLASVSGLAMATTIGEMNFPYLAGVFFVQLIVALLFIYGIQAAPIPRRKRDLSG